MHRQRMTRRKLEKLIECGRGIGIGDRYQPWIRITRHGTSATSNQSYVRMPGLSRHCCYLSRGERNLAQVLWWIGAADVREQYPLWPWQHPSPYCELDDCGRWPDHPGMISIAREAGIRLHNYPGLPAPAILTVDLMVTIQRQGLPTRLVGISCKPQDQYLHATPADRLRERLELDRLYCRTAGIDHLLLHPEQLPSVLIRQLNWLAPRAAKADLGALRSSAAYRRFVDRLRTLVYDIPAHRAIRAAGLAAGWDQPTADRIGRTAIWLQDIDVDLRVPVMLDEPLRPGGIALRNEIRRRIFREGSTCLWSPA